MAKRGTTPAARRAALEAFYAAHAAVIERAVTRRVSAPAAAIEDACQTAWAILMRHPDVTLDTRGLGLADDGRDARGVATDLRQRAGGGHAGQRRRPAAIDWVIAGGESGPRHRPLRLEHARELRDRCVAAGVPFFFKQHGGPRPQSGGRVLDGRTWDETPRVPAGEAAGR